MRKIVLVNQSSGYLMIDIANAFVQSGKYDEVVLVAGSIKPINIPLDESIKVEKIIKYNRNSTLKRMASWGIATLQVFLLILMKYRKYELFIVSNPPTLSFLSFFCNNSYSVLIFDVFPDGAVLGGFITEQSLFYRWWYKSTELFYKKARKVFTITQGMAKTIAKYCDPSKIEVVPIWSSSSFDTVIKKEENLFIKEQQVENKFIVMYSGNMGKGHELETLIDVADKMRNEKDLLILFVGEGWGKQALMELVNRLNLNEMCRFLPFQNATFLAHSLSAADIAVVSIAKEAGLVCVPSKTYNLLQLGKPLLCITGEGSELYRLVNEYQVGACFEKHQVSEIAAFIRKIKDNPLLKSNFESNALNAAQLHHTLKNAYVFCNES
jgi:glycosyltransferase involved in cell wall biosynthesis